MSVLDRALITVLNAERDALRGVAFTTIESLEALADASSRFLLLALADRADLDDVRQITGAIATALHDARRYRQAVPDAIPDTWNKDHATHAPGVPSCP